VDHSGRQYFHHSHTGGVGFDRFPAELIEAYVRYFEGFLEEVGVPLRDMLALGRADPGDDAEPFNMAYLAMRGSLLTNGVSRRHGEISRRIFQPLFPRWPTGEVPVGHVTNGIHVPSWDSAGADHLWTEACGKERWRGEPDRLAELITELSDEALWAMTGGERHGFIRGVRVRLNQQLGARGHPPEIIAQAHQVLDPNILTLGFARRFTGYKRPDLLLHDPARLSRLLNDPVRPVQLVMAGKAHPADDGGKRMIREWIDLAQQPQFRHRVVFLEDYDIVLAQLLVQGVDVWVNTPRLPWEACGTSGMKVLVNGGLNLSERGGWWDEAYEPEIGWAIGDDGGLGEAEQDARDASALYDILEREVVPEFYARDEAGMPRKWLARMRQSMSRLTPVYSSNRMARDYVEHLYLPAAAEFRRRSADGASVARGMQDRASRLRHAWPALHIGEPTVTKDAGRWRFSVPVYLGESITTDEVSVELYADPQRGEPPYIGEMRPDAAILGTVNGHLYTGDAPDDRPAEHYGARIRPLFPGARIPAELPLILWQR
jgi:glycogen phosphorylase